MDKDKDKNSDKRSKHVDYEPNIDEDEKKLQQHLTSCGLNVKKWTKVLKDELNVTGFTSLQGFSETEMNRLQKYAKEEFEKKNLKNLLKPTYTPEEIRAFKEMLTDLQNETTMYDTKQTDEVKKKLQNLQSKLHVPGSDFKLPEKKDELISFVNSVSNQFDKLEKTTHYEQLIDHEVLGNASGGLAFSGIYQNDLQRTHQRASTVIELKDKDKVRLKQSHMNQFDTTETFNTMEKYDKYHYDVETLGIKKSGKLKASYFVASVDIGGFSNNHQEKEKRTKHNFQKTYYCQVKSCTVPIRSFEMTQDSVCLTREALCWLGKIEGMILIGIYTDEHIRAKCIEFFKEFGCFVNLGLLEFGGTYTWKATYESQFSSNEKKTIEELTTALNGYATAGLLCGPKQIGGTFSRDKSTEIGKENIAHNEHKKQLTRFEISKKGGPIEVDNFYMWRYGLSTFNSTWSLLDRGNIEGIWKIVDTHKTDFSDSINMSNVLKDAWEKRQTLSNIDISKGEDFHITMNKLLQRMQQWSEENQPTTHDCIKIVNDLSLTKQQFKEVLELKWDSFLETNKTLQTFFSRLSKQKEQLDKLSIQLVKNFLRGILQPGASAKLPVCIEAWILDHDEQDMDSDFKFNQLYIENLKQFLEITEQKLIPYLESKKVLTTHDITIEFYKICIGCLNNMTNQSEFFSVILLTAVLVPYEFNVIHLIFEKDITVASLKEIKEKLQNWLPLLNAVKLGVRNKCIITNHFIENLRIRANINDDGKKIFEKYFLPIRTADCTDEFSEFLKGQEDSLEFELNEMQEKLLSLQSVKTQHLSSSIFPGTDMFESNLNQRTNNPEYIVSDSLRRILVDLGLNDYFPDKIQLRDVLSFKITSNPVLKNIPWMFLKGMILCDRRWRDTSLLTRLDQVNKPDADTYEDQWSMDTNTSSITDSNTVSLHPLDLTVVVHLCCSPTLKQLLAEKMWLSKLAFPLITPHPNMCVNLWSIRQCIIADHVKEKLFEEKSAADTNSWIVSVIRIDRISVSKSNIINKLISTQVSDTFHHKDCPQGNLFRVISNGTIESTWHPSTDGSITYLNLRGNAVDYEPQVKVLFNLSSVLVVMLPIDLLENECTKSILSMRCDISPTCGIIFACDGIKMDKKDVIEKFKSFIEQSNVNRQRTQLTGLSVRHEHISMDNICRDLKKKMFNLFDEKEKMSFSKRLESCYEIVSIDENSQVYREDRLSANGLINDIRRESSDTKSSVIPLQGQLLESLTYALKMSKKSTDQLENRKVDDYLKMVKEKRKEQANLFINKYPPSIKTILKKLTQTVPTRKNYMIFVRYLKLFLDSDSRMVIPRERKKYQNMLSKIPKEQTCGQLEDGSCKDELEKQEKALADASFGLEHLYREFGQVYEAMSSQTNLLKDDLLLIKNIPKVAAHLLLQGEAFELMNGDVGYVPLVWIESVFGQIKSIIGDKKVLILSVLGIQSSGKSTLLNTMFGLQFAVSAGRCTRGLYMQLFPVNNNGGFDYLLVVDTEGIRAPELREKNYNHDNELATFVIGLGDVIIINIKGENTAEITDILGIVVQALLRLKMTGKESHVRKRCIFVHQNVPASDAKDKMYEHRIKFNKELNLRTQCAAEEENVRDINNFSDILHFDVNDDVIYFPGLFDGSQRMTSVNHDYCEHAQQVTNSVLDSPIAGRNTYFTISDTFRHMKDLWNGLLADDFVFSFRNNLEINAYLRIQSKFQEIAFGLETYLNDYVCNECKTELLRKLEKSPLSEPMSLLQPIENDMITKFALKLSDQIQKLETIFDKDEKKDIVIQWKESKKNQLNELFKSLASNYKNRLKLLVKETRFRMKKENQISDFKTKAYNMAKKLAIDFRGKPPDKNILLQEFTVAWSAIADVPVDDISDTEDTIHAHIDSILCDMFHDRITTIKHFKTQSRIKWRTYDKTQKLCGSIENKDMDVKTQIIEKGPSTKQRLKRWAGMEGKLSSSEIKTQALRVTNFILGTVDIEIEKFSSTNDTKFETTFVKKMFNKIVTDINNHNNEGSYCFKFTKDHETFVLVHTSVYLQKKLTDLNANYNNKFSLKSIQEQHKDNAWKIFGMIVKSESEDAIAAFYFEEVLSNAVSEKISTKLPQKVAVEMIGTFYSSKWELIKEILLHLASERCFNEYFHYIKSPETFVRVYLQKRTNEKFFTRIRGATRYFNLASCQITNDFNDVSYVMYELHNELKDEKDKSNSEYADLLHSRLESKIKLSITSSAFAQVKLCLHNRDSFLENIVLKLEGLKKSVSEKFKDISEKNVHWMENPYDEMMKVLWGCDAKCPFCKEPCINAMKDHVKEDPHKCASHRVIGVAGWYDKETGILVDKFCNKCISEGSASFKHEGKYIKYRDYKTIFQDWDIPPNPEVSVYWKWFCWQYKNQLEKEYGRKIEICEHWKTLSMSEALKSITNTTS